MARPSPKDRGWAKEDEISPQARRVDQRRIEKINEGRTRFVGPKERQVEELTRGQDSTRRGRENFEN